MRESLRAFARRPGAASVAARLVLPRTLGLELDTLGTLSLQVDDVNDLHGEATTAAPAIRDLVPACETFALDASEPGLLMLDRAFARQLVNLAIGRAEAVAVCPPLSKIERGILAGLVAGCAARLGLPLGIAAAAATVAEGDPERLLVRASVRLGSAAGRAWLYVTAAAVLRGYALSRSPSTCGTSGLLRLELAETTLEQAQASSASPGDLVLFDETSALNEASPWSVAVCYADRRAPVWLASDGAVRIDEESRDLRPRSATAEAFAGMVWITAELAASSAAPASDRHGARGDAIVLRMGETDWAEGRLGEAEGRLAVRITRRLAG